MSKRKPKKKTPRDPNFAQEAEKYAAPVASREFIHRLLVEAGSPLDLRALIEKLELENEPDLQEALRRRVAAMIRDAQILKNRKGGLVPIKESDLIPGRISAHPDGYGFVLADDLPDDIYLSARQMRQVLHGDRVVVCITGTDGRGRKEGRIVDVVERGNQQIVGRLLSEQGIYFVAPDNKRIHQDLLISEKHLNGAKSGDMVIGLIVEQPTRKHPPVGEVAEVLGQHLKPGMETDVAIASHDIPDTWPQEVIDYVDKYADVVPEKDKADRRDVRQLPLVTIDGADARDFDDAIYCERRDSGWRLFVAIADVSHYVIGESALDQEALKRGTSVYFPNRVIPMLPEALSNGLCSLNPNVDRLCMLCEMTLDANGELKRTRFHKALMRSHQRFTYSEVAQILVEKDKSKRKQHKSLIPHLENLYRLFKVLMKLRKKRGAMEFESTETRMLFDEHQKISEIVPVQRNDAHRIVEECMILANIAAAAYLQKRRMPALYRVHASPNMDRLEDLRAFLALRGLSLDGGDSPSAQDFAKLTRRLAGRADVTIIQTVILRTMQQAVYQPGNEGHFGLALEQYAHFTSPIRRYPDLLVHRAIEHVLKRGKPADYSYSKERMAVLGESCSMTERRADEATRDVSNWLKCEYMLEHVGDEFDGIVSAVTSFGLFVQLPEFFIEGLVHVTSLDNDYYRFDQAAQALVGERSGIEFKQGDALRVVVAAVNLEERKIDFQPAGKPVKKRKKKSTGSKSKKNVKGKESSKKTTRKKTAKKKSRSKKSKKKKAKQQNANVKKRSSRKQ